MDLGGIAAEIHDLPVPATVDIDVTPARVARLTGFVEGTRLGATVAATFGRGADHLNSRTATGRAWIEEGTRVS